MAFSPDGLIDVDFSLALNDRTGKLFIGLDLLHEQSHFVGDVFYWRLSLSSRPGRTLSRILGRLLWWDLNIQHKRKTSTEQSLRHERPRRPILHLDPFTCLIRPPARHDVILCHDMGPVSHPHLFRDKIPEFYGDIYRGLQIVGPHMVFVSNATKNAFLSLYPGDYASLTVIYPPIRQAFKKEAVAESIPGLDAPFLLTVGNVGRRKNQRRAAESFIRSGLPDQGWRMVVCGGPEPGYEDVAAFAERHPSVILTGFVSDAQLQWLYNNAAGFVLLSNLEGFGFPVAEAVAKGLPLLVSRDSVLEEVAGPQALTADPGDIDDMARGLSALAGMSAEERQMRMEAMQAGLGRFAMEPFRQGWARLLQTVTD